MFAIKNCLLIIKAYHHLRTERRKATRSNTLKIGFATMASLRLEYIDIDRWFKPAKGVCRRSSPISHT